MQKQIQIIEDTFQFLEDDFNFEFFLKSPSSPRHCKSINYYREDVTIEIQLHKNLSYFYVNTVTEKDESFTITSFNTKLILCDDLNSTNLEKAKQKLLNLLNP